MEYVVGSEEQQLQLKLWIKNFIFIFACLSLFLAVSTIAVILIVSPFSTYWAKCGLEQQHDLNFVARACNIPREVGDVGYGKNEVYCNEARERLSKSTLQCAIEHTADDWNLCKAGGCADILFYVKFGFAVASILVVLLALKLALAFAERAMNSLFQRETLPSLTSNHCAYGSPAPPPAWTMALKGKMD